MKNAFKLGILALAVSFTVASCAGKKAESTSDTTKTDSSTIVTDTTKKDTTTVEPAKKDTVVTTETKKTETKKM